MRKKEVTNNKAEERILRNRLISSNYELISSNDFTELH